MAAISVQTLDNPEFINITSISPLISKCEIKVLYVGENRNRSFITKEVAAEMAQSLPGTPIVGHFVDNKEDFGDHGQQMIIDGEGVKFNTLTKPYGFVAPDSKVWFQKFEDTDEFGNVTVREYLMTEGYLWTEQFEECKRVVSNGNPQSMELDEKSLKGHWSTDNNRGVEFFIINDAIFSKLCILGEDVEPCFEGASVTKPEVSSHFSKNDNFNKTLFTMMQELKFALEGGQNMPEVENIVEETPVIESENLDVQDKIDEQVSEEIEEITEGQTLTEESEIVEAPVVEAEALPESEFVKKEDEEEKSDDKEEESSEDEKSDKEDEKEDDEDKKKYALLEQQYQELEAKFTKLNEEYQEIMNEKKDALINSFSMLDEADKKDVIDNKVNYSLDEIEAKLSVIFTRKQMSATPVVEEAVVEEVPVTYSLNNDMSNYPDWVKATLENEQN